MATLHRQRGISTTELVVTLGIISGCAYFAVPSLAESIRSATLNAAVDEFLADIHVARSEALKRNRRVNLCKSPDRVRCVKTGGWDQGWIIFHDDNGNGQVDPADEVLGTHAALGGAVHITGNQPVASFISYTPLGASKLTSGAFQAGTLTACRRSADTTPARKLVLNAIGRPRVQKATVPMCG